MSTAIPRPVPARTPEKPVTSPPPARRADRAPAAGPRTPGVPAALGTSSKGSPRIAVRELLRAVRVSARRAWDEAPGDRRLMYLTGAALAAAGLVQAGIWAVTGGSASGPLSWRKPVTFGLSFGVTTVTLAAVAAYLPMRRWIGWVLSILLCASTAIEVIWVSVQHARGVPSHFNGTNPLDGALFTAAGITIGVTILVMAVMTVLSFVRTTAPAPMAWAIRAGLVALLAAQGVGLWMIFHGEALLDAGADLLTRSMTTYGLAGAMKYAHAVPMHAIQVFMAQAWLLGLSGVGRGRQARLVAAAIAGYASLFAVALLRTAAGLAPFDLSASTLMYLIPAVLLAGSGAATLAHVYRALAGPRSGAPTRAITEAQPIHS
ncbi:hypothetical protein [Sphaerisporangium dianthi]|uniref:Uncharacterized protein n=1 Tax=Sphaerisporangium dianthi TaxID=1436120 RepID=A0ABV9CLH0_9ACTN